jgi:predicted secreted protein
MTATAFPPTATPIPTVPAEVQVRVEDNGSQIELVTGQTLVVILTSSPSTGYEWTPADTDATVLQQLGEKEFTPDPNAPADAVGVGGVEIFRFTPATAGEMMLQLFYSRPWESVQPLETFSIQVTVR